MPDDSEFFDIIIRAKNEASKDIDKTKKSIDNLDKSSKKTTGKGGGFNKFGEAVNDLKGNIPGTTDSLNKLEDTISSLGGVSRVASTGLGKLALGVTAIAAAIITAVAASIKLTSSMIEANSTAEGYQVRLNRLLGSVSEGNRLFKEAAKYASSVAFEYQEIMGAVTALSGVLRGGVDEITKYLPVIGDLAAAAGLDIQTTTQQFIRMWSAGAASADLFRERGILAMLGFQSGVSYSVDETRKKLLDAWNDPLSKFRGAAGDLSTTWRGILSMMSDWWFQFLQKIGESGRFGGAFNYIKANLNEVLNILKSLNEDGSVEKFADTFSNKLITAIELGVKITAIFVEGWNALKYVWLGLKSIFAFLMEAIFNGIAFANEIIARYIDSVSNAIAIVNKKVADSLKSYTKLVRENNNELKKTAGYWYKVAYDTGQAAKKLAESKSAITAAAEALERAKKSSQEIADKFKDGKNIKTALKDGKNIKTALVENLLKSQVARLNAITQTGLKQLEISYKESQNKLSEYYGKRVEIVAERINKENEKISKYYDERTALITKQIQKEIELLEYQRDKEKYRGEEADPNKILQFNDKIFAAEEKLRREILSLDTEKNEKIKTNQKQSVDEYEKYNREKLKIEKLFQEQKARLLQKTEGTGLQGQFLQETIALQDKHASELQELQDFHKTELEYLRKQTDDKLQIDKLYAEQKKQIDILVTNQLLEQQKLAQEQQLKLTMKRFEVLGEIASDATNLFNDLYELSGKKNKEFARAAKLTSIAMATINVAEGVTKAIAQGGFLGLIKIPLIIASGAVQIAKISSQAVADGGIIAGTSPTSKSDDKLVAATSGEFMQPVSSVKKFGLDAMEVIRRGTVPRDVLRNALGLGRNNLSFSIMGGKPAYATGGAINNSSGFGFSPGNIKVELINKSNVGLETTESNIRYDHALKKYIVGVVVDAKNRNVAGINRIIR